MQTKIIILLLLLTQGLQAQNRLLHTPYFEFGGVAGKYSINYELRVSDILKGLHAGVAVGLNKGTTNVQEIPYTLYPIRGVLMYGRKNICAEVAINYLFGDGLLLTPHKSLPYYIPYHGKQSYWFWSAGLRYQHKKGIFFKANVIPIKWSEKTVSYLLALDLYTQEIKKQIVPIYFWYGVSAGYSF